MSKRITAPAPARPARRSRPARFEARRRPAGMGILAVLVAVLASCGRVQASAPSEPPARPASCSDVDLVFARGTNQPPGLGRVGDAFLRSFRANTVGRTVSSYAVKYPADAHQDFSE